MHAQQSTVTAGTARRDDLDVNPPRTIALLGLAFVVIVVVSVFALPTAPDVHTSAAKSAAFAASHKSSLYAKAYLLELAVVVGVFYFWYLRDFLSDTDRNRRSATIGFAGGLIFAVAGTVAGGIAWMTADAVGHVSPSVMQTINVLSNDLNGVMTGAGVAIFLIGMGVAVTRSATLPHWLGWLGVVLAVPSLLLPGIGTIGAGLWLLITSIVILTRRPQSVALPG
jgi:hypothetical protein